MVKEVIDKVSVRAEEAFFLSRVGEMIDKAISNLKEEEFGVAQGALRAVFNGLSGLIHDSSYLSRGQKEQLGELNEQIFQLRDDLVRKVEVERTVLGEAVSSSKAYERLAQVKKTFTDYIDSWYKT